MTVREFYNAINADYDAVISRMVNETLIMKYLRKFPSDPNFAQLQQAVKEENYDTAYRAVHTLKGLCLSLGFESMSTPVIALNDDLRAGRTQQAEAYIADITPLYNEIVDLIGKL